MIDPDVWPICYSISFRTPEDAKKMADLLNGICEHLTRLDQELEGQWEHIRNLEYHLLAPGNQLQDIYN